VLWWVAVARALLVSAAVAFGAITGGLVDAMVWLCIANAVTLVFYCWTVFRTDGAPFLRSFLVTCRPMASAFAMAVAVRFVVAERGDLDVAPVVQIAIGGAAGAIIYTVLVLVTERALVRDLLGMVARLRGAASARPAA